jgi:hypothetical protein
MSYEDYVKYLENLKKQYSLETYVKILEQTVFALSKGAV